jgi:hypothetical protein
MSASPHEMIERHYDRPRLSTPKTEVHVIRASMIALRLLMGEGFYKYMFEDHVLLLDETLVHGVHPIGPLCIKPSTSAGLPPRVASAERRRFERDFWQGFVIRAFGDPAGRLAAIGRDRHLVCEAELCSGGPVLRFDGPECSMRLPGRLPHTVVTAVVGRTVAEVLKHDVLSDCRAVISRVEQRGRSCRMWFTDQHSLIEARVRVFTDGRHPPF